MAIFRQILPSSADMGPRQPLCHLEADKVLCGGMARGALHEIFAEDAGPPAIGFTAVLALTLAGGKPIFWIASDFAVLEYGSLCATGFAEVGGDPAQLILLRLSHLRDALKAAGGHVKLWLFQGVKHDCWTRAFNEPELPKWLLDHRGGPTPEPAPVAWAERIVVPLHPAVIKLPDALLDSYVGEYFDAKGQSQITIYRQGDALFQKNAQGEVSELAPESNSTFFFPNGGQARVIFERDAQGKTNGFIYRDDRHEEHWELVKPVAKTHIPLD